MKKSSLLIILLSIPVLMSGQETAPKSDTLRKDALNVYMTINDNVRSDYIRKEIPYVNYVRDVKDAGIYIISTSQRTGSGGSEFSYFLVGQNENAGMRDTLKFVSSPDETQDEIRIKEVRTLKMGLMRYVAKTPLSKYMTIGFSEPLSETVTSDKWNSWVFNSSINGFLQGQKTYNQHYLSGNISASRVTKDWKINIRSNLSQSNDKYVVDDTTTIRSTSSSKNISALVVRSISEHWSIGGTTRLGASKYSNERFLYSFMPGIEYDLFPYSESTRRQLRILYSAGYSFVNYIDTTIYDKMRETLWTHSLTASYEVVQKWGNINISVGYSNYLKDWTKNNLNVSGFLTLRIAKGLSIDLGGSASLIHDQLGLVKGDVALDEILLQRQEMATQYSFFTSFGLTYTFGSIYNNVVNPRFGNNGGGGMSFSFGY
jgi:hypothetical protein